MTRPFDGMGPLASRRYAGLLIAPDSIQGFRRQGLIRHIRRRPCNHHGDASNEPLFDLTCWNVRTGRPGDAFSDGSPRLVVAESGNWARWAEDGAVCTASGKEHAAKRRCIIREAKSGGPYRPRLGSSTPQASRTSSRREHGVFEPESAQHTDLPVESDRVLGAIHQYLRCARLWRHVAARHWLLARQRGRTSGPSQSTDQTDRRRPRFPSSVLLAGR